MEIRLYTGFEKKNNSTKQPDSNATYITVTGDLREPCSVMNPTIEFKRLSSDIVPYVYNYALISAFGRYYFIKDWTWNNGLWLCEMVLDVLASHKNKIGNQTEYILRTDSDVSGVYNPWVCDTMYPATSYFSKEQTLFPNYPFAGAYSNGVAGGMFVIGVISGENSSDSSVGAITYYAMTANQFATLKGVLFGDANLVAMGLAQFDPSNPGTLIPLVDDMSLEMTKALYNPYQYIASCMWFPFSVSDIDSDARSWVSSIQLGWWSYPVNAYRLLANIKTFGQHVTPPSHPYASTRGYYLNYAPYTRRKLMGVIGETPIDCGYIGANDDIGIVWNIDLITGQCRVDISVYDNTLQSATNYRIIQREFLIGVPIQLAQIATDYLGVAVTAFDASAKTVGNLFSLNLAGAGSAVAHGIYDTLSSSMPQMETSGSNGSFLVVNNGIGMISEFFLPVDEDIHHKGRPVCANRQINTLSGFVLCAEGDFDIACLDEEREMIKQYLTTGFFWE